MNRSAGMSLVQVLMAAVAVAGLGLVVSSMMTNLNRTQKIVSTLNVASDLETRFRAVTLSSRALANIRVANPELAKCFDVVGCPATSSQDIELRDAANNVLIPRPSAPSGEIIMDDGGSVCVPSASQPSCRWRASASIQPLDCTAPGCQPTSFDLTMELKPRSVIPGETPLAPRVVRAKALPREMFMGVPALTLTCPDEQMMKGIKADGTPDCVDGFKIFCEKVGGVYDTTKTPPCAPPPIERSDVTQVTTYGPRETRPARCPANSIATGCIALCDSAKPGGAMLLDSRTCRGTCDTVGWNVTTTVYCVKVRN